MTGTNHQKTPRAYSNAEIGGVLRALREAHGRSATEVAHAAGLSPAILLHKAETGRACLTAAQLSGVLTALGANFQILHWKLTGEDLDSLTTAFLADMTRFLRNAGS